MIRKLFNINFNQGGAIAHSAISIVPKIDDIAILDIYVLGNSGERINLIKSSIKVDKPILIKYDLIVSSSIFIDISNKYIEDLSIGDILNITVSTNNNTTYGSVIFDETKVMFHQFMSVKYSIDNAEDSFVNLKLGLKCYDRFNNLQHTDTVVLGLNEDNFVIKKQVGGNSVLLDYEPIPESVGVIINGSYTKEYTIDGKSIIIDVPDNTECYIIYQPYYIKTGQFVDLTDNLEINSNNEIKFKLKSSDYILYTAELEVVNTNLSNSNSSPIIKNISIITSDR